ncbi:MAG TPA: nucleotide exchange factor GrpE [Acidimicrobiales bacterium]|nr:nucleotide exchange factor GrpE [Acidimicrobiales bacterium]
MSTGADGRDPALMPELQAADLQEQDLDAEVREPPAESGTAPAEAVAPVEALAEDAAAVARQRDEYLEALRRVQAEFDNYRKRTDRQHHEIVEYAAMSLVKRLLPVLDTADLALAHGGGDDVKQLAGALMDVLAKEGLERLDAEGQPFDPTHHEAVVNEPGAESLELPQVSEVLRAGYRWRGRLIRPAMVKVRS